MSKNYKYTFQIKTHVSITHNVAWNARTLIDNELSSSARRSRTSTEGHERVPMDVSWWLSLRPLRTVPFNSCDALIRLAWSWWRRKEYSGYIRSRPTDPYQQTPRWYFFRSLSLRTSEYKITTFTRTKKQEKIHKLLRDCKDLAFYLCTNAPAIFFLI